MENLYVESIKSYNSGFLLKEQDFHKIVKTVTEQFEKAKVEKIEWTFSVKFKNGVVAKTQDYSEIIQSENEGLKQIVELDILAFENDPSDESFNQQERETSFSGDVLDGKKSKYSVLVHFSSLEDRYLNSSIKIKIKGISRDWVFLVTSELEERISKIKRIKWPRVSDGLATTVMPLIIVFGLFFPIFSRLDSDVDPYNKIVRDYNSVVKKYNEDSTYTSSEVILNLEKNRLRNEVSQRYDYAGPSLGLAAFVAFMFFGAILVLFAGRWLQIPFVFYWGEYMEIFDRREKVKSFVIYTVVIGIILSIISNYISDYLK